MTKTANTIIRAESVHLPCNIRADESTAPAGGEKGAETRFDTRWNEAAVLRAEIVRRVACDEPLTDIAVRVPSLTVS